MFPTCLDNTIERLSTLEKLPPLSRVAFQDRRIQQRNMSVHLASLRFFRLFLWCFPDCDSNLLTDMNCIATCIPELYKSEETYSSALGDYNSLLINVAENLTKCYLQVNKYRYLQRLISSSLEAEPFTGNETIEFLDSIHVNFNDLLKFMNKTILPTWKIQLESLVDIVFLLRNLVYYTPMGDQNYYLIYKLNDSDTNPGIDWFFQFNVHEWANKAACLFILRCLSGRADDEESRRLYVDLQQNVSPCNPFFIKLCFEAIKVAEMKREDDDRLLFGEFVSRFVDFFLENLEFILNDDLQMVREGLIFIITFLADPPTKTTNHSEILPLVQEQIYAILDQASDNMCFYCEINMDLARGKTILDDFLKSVDQVRRDTVNLYVQDIPHSPLWSNFPRIDRLGHFECLLAYLENLKEAMNNDRKLVPFLKHQILSIHQELLPLRLFLQDTSKMQNEYNGLKDVWEQITSLTYQVDFAIKSSFFTDSPIWYNLTCLSFIIKKIKDIRYEVIKIKFETQTEAILPLMSSIDVPKPSTSTSNIVEAVVGFKREIKSLIDRLEGGSARLDIVSIVGMGGIGKTTLARKLYNEPSVVHRFHKRAFCSVSQVYRKRNVLLDILSDLSLNDDEIRRTSDDDLAHQLRKSLLGFRYLIVVDDIWDINVWYDLKASFPDDSNGSRVIFTTRINNISLITKPDSAPCPLPFLSNDESWELLQQKIFRKDHCPPHLENMGKLIAENCKGLPLAIVVIAGLLLRTERSLLEWNKVADTLKSFASSEGCNEIITLSYKHLPEALKSCFLYLGAFLEDEIIEAKKLKLLWIAEGFVLKPGSSSSRKTAKKYLSDLGDRNLVTVTKRSCNGGIKVCRVHDLIRDFCRTEAQKEHYMCYINADNKNFSMYRISIEAEWISFVNAKPKGPTVHSLLYFSDSPVFFSQDYVEVSSFESFLCNFKLVEVLDLLEVEIEGNFPVIVTTLVHLRYLALRYSYISYIPPEISNLWNLETLVLGGFEFSIRQPSSIVDLVETLEPSGSISLPIHVYEVRFPHDFWKMKRLRHVEAIYAVSVALDDLNNRVFTLDDVTNRAFYLLSNLETFKSLSIPPGEDGEELLRRLPNLRKLSCFCSGWSDARREWNQLPKLEILTKLESLSMFNIGAARPPFIFSFPSTIRKLRLRKFFLPWKEFSAIIGMLPHLEVLVLRENSFTGKRWDMEEDEEFPNIKSLTLKALDIQEWNVSVDSFPSLENLFVSECHELTEIPLCFSEVYTLKYIEVRSCRKSVVESAIQIQKDQFDSGNESFEVDHSRNTTFFSTKKDATQK